MANPQNSFNTFGRLVTDPVFKDNKDGSKRVYIKLALNRNYKDKATDTYGADFIPFEGFIPKDKTKSRFYTVHQGDIVSVNFELKSDTYQAKDKDGNLLVKDDGTPQMTGRVYQRITEIDYVATAQKNKSDVASADDDEPETQTQAA